MTIKYKIFATYQVIMYDMNKGTSSPGLYPMSCNYDTYEDAEIALSDIINNKSSDIRYTDYIILKTYTS